jgi:hypothetical protein
LFDRSVGIVSTMILARLLVPADFRLEHRHRELRREMDFADEFRCVVETGGLVHRQLSAALAFRRYWRSSSVCQRIALPAS